MNSFLSELRNRNASLYWFGWYNFAVGIICIVLMQFDAQQILGISRWIKPMKFFFSVGIMVWTMGCLLYYLKFNKSVKTISWLIIISMFIENIIIMLQSARGERSHFNVQEPMNAMLFSIMGIFILLFTFTSIYAAVLFFRQKEFAISESYVWGIRLGLILFIIFSLEGGIMIAKMTHTIGGADGGPGLPVVNWSTQYGDLRIAHFFGMHALQILPLAGYYIFKKSSSIFVFGTLYFFAVSTVFFLALKGVPLLSFWISRCYVAM